MQGKLFLISEASGRHLFEQGGNAVGMQGGKTVLDSTIPASSPEDLPLITDGN